MARERRPDIRTLARRRAWLPWLLLFCLTSPFQFSASWSLLPGGPAFADACRAAHFFLHVPMAGLLVGVLLAKDEYRRVMVFYSLLMLVPIINVYILAFAYLDVTRILRAAGVSVGFLRVDHEQLELALESELCKGCRYSLRGNVSGICPECGRPREAPDDPSETTDAVRFPHDIS